MKNEQLQRKENREISAFEADAALSAAKADLLEFGASKEMFDSLQSLKDRFANSEGKLPPQQVIIEAEKIRDRAREAHVKTKLKMAA